MIKVVHTSSCKVPVVLVRLRNLNILDKLSKNILISNFIKFRTVETELFHAEGRKDGRTDRHGEDHSLFSKF
jgi:hypothetical protein